MLANLPLFMIGHFPDKESSTTKVVVIKEIYIYVYLNLLILRLGTTKEV